MHCNGNKSTEVGAGGGGGGVAQILPKLDTGNYSKSSSKFVYFRPIYQYK